MECGTLQNTSTSGLRIPVKRDEPDTYNSLFDLNLNHGGLIQHHQWGHAQYVWDVRQNPKVAEVYNKLYGDDLLVSFDGVNVFWKCNVRKEEGVFPWKILASY